MERIRDRRVGLRICWLRQIRSRRLNLGGGRNSACTCGDGSALTSAGAAFCDVFFLFLFCFFCLVYIVLMGDFA